eukprot:gene7346-biopygen5937
MDKLEKAKRKRKSHRGTATKLMHKIEDVLGQENKDKLRIEQCLADLKEKAETLKVDKFKYLKSFLEEPARSVVSGFPLTDADYDSALELLKGSKDSQPQPTAPVLDPTASAWVGNTGSEGRVALQTALAVVNGTREGKGETIRGGPEEPVAVKTSLGWVISGPLKGEKLASVDANVNLCVDSMFSLAANQKDDLDTKVQKLWDLDSLGIREGNKQAAQGIIERVTELEATGTVHYLPHRAVERENAETLRHHIQKYEEEDPDFVSKMIGGFFVDDLVTGCENTEKAVSLYERAKERMKEGGFHLRKWKTNDRRLAREIAVKEEEGVKERITPEIEDTSYVKETLGAPVSMGEKTKVLGITWDNHKDTWEFNLGNRGSKAGVSEVVKIDRHSTLSKLLRVTAYVQRFIANLRELKAGRRPKLGALEVEEMERAERLWIKDAQDSLRGSDEFEKLSVQLGVRNEDELLVCKGRLGNADFEYRRKHPILLPKQNAFTDLVIYDCHARVHHNKLRSTLTELRGRFWVPRGRQQVKRVGSAPGVDFRLANIHVCELFEKVLCEEGYPRLINTDNGLTFKAADSLLKKLKLDHTFQGFLDHHRITWKFNLPLSPWWGGYFERMTLTYLYDELGDVLTPSHLLYGHRFSSLSEGIDPHSELDESDDKVCKRFLYLTKKLSHFWNRWRKEYLTDLREFHKMSNSETVPVEKGDLVLLQEDNVKRGQWKAAIVEEIIYGKDREPRGATVRKYEKGKPSILNRPLQRLYPLEISCNDSGIMNGEKQSATQDGESNVGKENESRRQSSRVAAKDARWKSKLMLDP